MIDSLNLKAVQRKAKCEHQIRAIEQMGGFKVEHEGKELKVTDFSGQWVDGIVNWIKAQH